MCGKINVIYSSLIVHLHLKLREIRLSVMCGKLRFIVHGQRKEKERWAFDDRFFLFFKECHVCFQYKSNSTQAL